MARSNAGGGAGSRQVVRKPVRTGQGATRIRHAGVAQKGQAQGNHVSGDASGGGAHSTGYHGINARGGAMGGMGAVPLGNEVALNVGKGGPGTGRTTYKTGTQQTQGAVNPGNPSGRRDILSEYGPDSAAVRRR